MRGIAQGRIPYGASVLCRAFRVTVAPPEIANGTAKAQPFWARRGRDTYEDGEFVDVEPITGLGQRNLQALADGPIMDSNKIYLPAGKVSEAEYQLRLDEQFRQAGIDR